jgi:hypothetical protein
MDSRLAPFRFKDQITPPFTLKRQSGTWFCQPSGQACGEKKFVPTRKQDGESR